MVCHLFSAKPLSEPMLDYWQLGPWEHISVKFESVHNSSYCKKCISKCCLQNVSHLISATIIIIAKVELTKGNQEAHYINMN